MFEQYTFSLSLGDRDINRLKITKIGLTTGDVDAYEFVVSIEDHDGYASDLSWVTGAEISFLKSDGSAWPAQPMDISLKANGIVSYQLGEEEIQVPGNVISSIKLSGGTTIITTERFLFTVSEDIFNVAPVVSTGISIPKIYKVSTEPTTQVVGDFWYNTTTNIMTYWNGTAWV